MNYLSPCTGPVNIYERKRISGSGYRGFAAR
jgi:hypothetical protein